ncbi:MAG: hypothetical protein MUC77_02495 [Chromatiaceae bacterium]|jgi:hypothetical protein|nr:hypothetical protein [Chromatiaceae bacterium]
MKTSCRFAYVQARVQARFAALPSAEEWQRLAASRSLAAFLEDARSGPLRPWVKALSGQSTSQDVEVGMRVAFQEAVEEVADWVPEPWREAVRWTRWLSLIGLWHHLARGEAAPDWVRQDPLLSPLLNEDGRLDPRGVQAVGVAPLLGGDDPAAAWAEHWRALWPHCKREFLGHLDALGALLLAHLAAFYQARPESAWGLRLALCGRLRLLFHRRLLQPAGPLIYLALVALELERLRAELVTRALFAPEAAI